MIRRWWAVVVALWMIGCIAQAQSLPHNPTLRPALWQVRHGDTTLWVFGTIHVLKPGAVWLTGPVAEALRHADELVTEIDADDTAAAGQLLRTRGALPAGETLAGWIGPVRQRRVVRTLRKVGLDPHVLDHDKPWLAALVLALVPLGRAGYGTADGVEAALAAAAHDHPCPRHGLERAEDQIALFDTLSRPAQRALLDGALGEVTSGVREAERMAGAWGRGDVTALARMMNADLTDPGLTEAMLYARNRRWAQALGARLSAPVGHPQTVFVAVGAGHLAGRGNMLALLAGAGFVVTRVQ